jgi:hypothetical protein
VPVAASETDWRNDIGVDGRHVEADVVGHVAEGHVRVENVKQLVVPNPFSDAELVEDYANSSSQFAASANRRFEFYKRSQLFAGTHNVTLSVAAMRVSNPDCLPLRING